MNFLIIGRPQDCIDHAQWCQAHGHASRYLLPDAIDNITVSWSDDIASFHDIHQPEVERLRTQRGLPTRDKDAVTLLTDKPLFKAHRAVAPYCVRHIEIDPLRSPADAMDIANRVVSFPVVVKPSNGFYSAGVMRADDAASFKRAYVQARRMCLTLPRRVGSACVIVETYLPGNEFAVDGFVHDGQVMPLLIHRKRPRLNGPTFHEAAYLTERFDPSLGHEASVILERVIQGVGLRESAFHAEFRFGADGRLYVLELAPRLAGGGATTHHLLAACTGLDAYEILHGLGRGTQCLDGNASGFGLEYDFAAQRTGFLRNVSQVASACRALGASAVIEHRLDGEFVFGPPSSVEGVLTAFFSCSSLEDAEALFVHVHNYCRIETEIV